VARDYQVEPLEEVKHYEQLCRHLMQRWVELEGGTWNEQRFREVFQPDWDSGQTLAQLWEGLRQQQ
ncbi:MAG: hypothetical protein ACXU86_19625, partial [Archangium sp.]